MSVPEKEVENQNTKLVGKDKINRFLFLNPVHEICFNNAKETFIVIAS